nr:uncharacterized protein topaz1 isoform X2 [Nothobranchius furzeri]
MFPTSGRVKLNRVALADVGLKGAPRRRRPPKPETNVSTDSTEKQGKIDFGLISEEDAALTRTTGYAAHGRLGERGVVAFKEPEVKHKQRVPNTRGKYHQSKANSSSSFSVEENRRKRVRLGWSFPCVACTGSEQFEARHSKGKARLDAHGEAQRKTAKRPFRAEKAKSSCAIGRVGARDGQTSMKAPGSVNQPGPGTLSVSSPTSKINRKNPREPDGSSECSGSPGGSFCGERKSISPQWKSLVHQEPQSSSPGSEPAVAKVSQRNLTTEKPAVWERQYPKVTLCDVAEKCHACSHNCGYTLPDVLKTRVVHCFKQDMKAEFCIWPACSRQKNEIEGSALNHNNKSSPSIPAQKVINQLQSPPEHKHLEGDTDSHKTQSSSQFFPNCFTGEEPAACFLLTGKQTHENSGPGSDVMDADSHKDKRMKLGENGGRSRTCDSPLTENIREDACGQRGDLTETFVPSDVSSESSEDSDDPETFICQRVKAYFREMRCTCARTYMCWPFSGGSAGSAESAGTGTPNQTSSSTKPSMDKSSHTLLEQQMDFTGQNRTRCTNLPSHMDNTNMKRTVSSGHSEGCSSSLPLETVLLSSSNLSEKDPGDTTPRSPFLMNGPGTDGSTPTPSSLELSQRDMKATSSLSPSSGSSMQDASGSLSGTPRFPSPPSGLSEKVQDAELPIGRLFLCCGNTQPAASDFSSSASSANSCHLSMSPSFLQGKQESSKLLTDLSPPELEKCPCPFDVGEHYEDLNECRFAPVLSPVLSPEGPRWRTSIFFQSSSSSENEEQKVMGKDTDRTKTSPDQHMAPGVSSSRENNYGDVYGDSTPQSSSNSEDVGDLTEKECPNESEQDSLDLCVPAEAHCPPSSNGDRRAFSHEEQSSDVGGGSGSKGRQPKAGSADHPQPTVMDEFTAYEQDILLLNAPEDNPELFENLPKESLLNLGPARPLGAPLKNPTASLQSEQRAMPVIKNILSDVPDGKEESDSRPWRRRCCLTTPTQTQNTCPAASKQTRRVDWSGVDMNNVDCGLGSRVHSIQTGSISNIPPPLSAGNGPWIRNAATGMDLKHQKFKYCRKYFSESSTCVFKTCRFQHLPVEGDEKFCVEIVARFTRNPVCLQKAVAVFTGYYQNSPPGEYFSMPLLLSLLWALLKASSVSDVFSVLTVSLAYNVVPGHEFLLALFKFVRENGLTRLIPKLMQLTVKMADVGLLLNLDYLDCIKNTPMFQQMVHPSSPVAVSANHNTPTPEYLKLAHAVVEMELCIQLEDWKQMGEVFKVICRCYQHPNQVERISGHIAIALLSESKDRVSLPFAAFMEMVCQNEDADSPLKSFVGRIGVSLMLRYYKTHQWCKGSRVVELMSVSKVGYTTLKGLFGNEDGASRCCLVTVATELFLMSGSVEGALKTLRENSWFLSSSMWPCEPTDLESRTRVLIRLSEKTSHRDTMEVLCNLPGINDPDYLIDISRYGPLFNSHLHVCVEKRILPVASDTVDFMLCKNLPVEHSLLRTLVHKLGTQNLWLRARGIFKRSLSSGYHPEVSAPPGTMALTVPCQLGEVELALSLEMFITVNAAAILPLPEDTTLSLSITLKRTQSSESEYISAGSRVLSAARIPQPKLMVHYTSVNSSQEQVFRLEVSSACRWLHHNHLWASEMWTH